jgi:formylglycine-generating enzyme required for sulfatase activity
MLVRSSLALGAVGLALLVPDPPALAAASRGSRSIPPISPVERALSGGLAVLRAPASTMIHVARGKFLLGSTSEQVLEAVQSCGSEPLAYRCTERTFSNELPQLVVENGSFLLDRSEVTVAAYERCVSAGACAPRVLEGGARRLSQPELPVTLVSFVDAENYCRFRRVRLPSEAEFERAARGTQGRRYPWGNRYHGRRANHGRLGLDPSDASDGFSELAPVGSFPSGQTPNGFLDLAGNAAEWTRSSYSESHGVPADPAWQGARVIRGGHFASAGAWLRGAARSPLDPDQKRVFVGFRCAAGLVHDAAP